MAAAVKAWKQAGDALADALAATQSDVAPTRESLGKAWFSPEEYASACGLSLSMTRERLRTDPRFEKIACRYGRARGFAYRLRAAR